MTVVPGKLNLPLPVRHPGTLPRTGLIRQLLLIQQLSRQLRSHRRERQLELSRSCRYEESGNGSARVTSEPVPRRR